MSFTRFLFFLFAGLILLSCQNDRPTPQILVFSKTNGYRHASIEAGIEAIRQLGTEHGFRVEATEDSTFFTEENLQRFAAVVFLSTSGDVLNYREKAEFQRFIEAGGGFAGVHGAAATEYDWKWYGKLLGAFLDNHPDIQPAEVSVTDNTDPATSGLPAKWQHTDEWYNFRPVPPADKVLWNVTPAAEKKSLPADELTEKGYTNVPVKARWDYSQNKPFLPPAAKVLLTVDESSYTGSKHGASHPVAWCQEYEGGRSFYTALGHGIDAYSDSLFLQHLLGGIQFAIGENRLDFSKAKTKRIPPDDRFVRTVLADNLDEPMELEVFPDGKVMIVERKGAIKIYDPLTDTIETVCKMPVFNGFEEGLLGVAIDPDWEKNKWIYLYYSLSENGRRNRLSRFVFDNNMLHVSTEKMLLEVPELLGCCHAGGSVEFDKSGNLYLSTGDNTNPFESDGFAPIDERPGRALWDAQKSAANANDLRGKILRIKPEADGTYSIPEGNLFPPGTSGTRPEIFVMGCRNPFRIAIDSKTGCLFWGDVGPDAGKDGVVRGPKGYDSWNRACEAGNYGWPLVRGNHIYYDYNFTQKKSGPLFDPERPVNNSPNNTGIQTLPPVQNPLIWYSYDESLEFPWLGTGGKNPMAGPIFHAADFEKSNPAAVFPSWFEGKFFIYEWMRNWIYLVTLDEAGNFVQADPFLPNEKFSRPMDMIFGKDGALYVLEYGQQWFAQNPDARLNKIEYAPGNRKPIARLDATPKTGAEPLTVRFSAAASVDYDKDPLRYEWIVKGGEYRSNASAFDYTFKTPGMYDVVLKVTDPSGASSRASTQIAVGNSAPSVAWQLVGNQTFYWDDVEIPYRLEITDKEDGSLHDGRLDNRRVKISIDYLPEGKDIAAIVKGHQTQSSAASLQHAGGLLLIEKSDCKTCHAEDRKINGPSYVDIANRYYGSEFAVNDLSDKVINGGAGNWGETAMSAHPNLTKEEAVEIVRYILSLAGEVQTSASLPYEGAYRATAHTGKEEKGAYIFQASYIDQGGGGAPSLSAKEIRVLRYPKIEAESFDKASKGVRKTKSGSSDTTLVTDLFNGRFLAWQKLDLTGVGSVKLGYSDARPGTGVELRLNAPNGPLAGKAALGNRAGEATIPIQKQNGLFDIYLVIKNEKTPDKSLTALDWLHFLN